MEKAKLHAHRISYELQTLDSGNLLNNPYSQFQFWLDEAIKKSHSEANAMSLATSDKKGNTSVRMVLLKEFSEEGFVFFTNYKSNKGEQLKDNPNAALLFFWPELQRQVRIEGTVKKVTSQVSDDYFISRPFDSQIAAITSAQSTVIPDRSFLDNLYNDNKKIFTPKNAKRPRDWGGYTLRAKRIEFWQGRSNRLHDRFLYELRNKNWVIERLAP